MSEHVRHDGSDTMGEGMRFYDIAKLLAAKREENGWSMNKVAKMVGTSQSSVHYWEKGRRAPNLVSLLHWCDVLGYKIVLEEVDVSESSPYA